MPNSDQGLPDKEAIRAVFDRVAGRYDEYAALEREVGSRLMDRLAFQRREPARIIDLGSGTGYFCAALKRRFRKAEVIGLDSSAAMSRKLSKRSNFFHPLRAVSADLSLLPIAGSSVDLVYSNLSLQWCPDFRLLSEEFRRILRPGGLLLFSNLGPGSLKEFRSAGGQGDHPCPVRQFVDMHEIGDALLAAGFSAPVMDSEHITTEYRQFDTLLTELEMTGASTHFGDWENQAREEGQLAVAYRAMRRNGAYPVTWEIVYGAAFGPEEGQPVKTRAGDVATFSVDSLRSQLPRRRKD